MPPHPAGAMGGVPMSVGDGMSWAWSKFKENALILIVGIGLWTVLSSFTIEAHYNINGEEHGFGLVGPSGTYIPFALTGAGLYILGGITLIGWLVTVPLVMLLSAYSYVRIQGYDVVR